ncbi:MAG: hypothetical protein JO250_02890 [Armatimonadetes bacterium]|nr:hypothetical protein [Armatimonadota bacterium]
MRFNRDIIAIVILILVFIVGGLLLGGHDRNTSRQVGAENPPDPSIYNDRATGSKGVFDWTGRVGYRAKVWRQPWSALDGSHADFLMVIDPEVADASATLTGGQAQAESDPTALAAADAPALQNWVAQGHTALLLTSRLVSGHANGNTGGPDTFADSLGVFTDLMQRPNGRTEFAPQQPTQDAQGILSLHSDAPARVRQATPTGVALFGDSAGPLVVTRAQGKGHLFIVADGGFAANDNFGRSENARFVANLLAHYAAPGATVLFDEYHHGDAALAAGASVWGALGWPLQLALIQLGLAAVVLVGVLAIRFGAPIPLLRGVRRTSGEYVTSLAGLYQRAQASTTALETLYRAFLRDLCGRLALAPDVSLEQLAETASRRGQTDRERLRRLLAACEERLDTGRITEAELLDLVRRMERVRKDMGIA